MSALTSRTSDEFNFDYYVDKENGIKNINKCKEANKEEQYLKPKA